MGNSLIFECFEVLNEVLTAIYSCVLGPKQRNKHSFGRADVRIKFGRNRQRKQKAIRVGSLL